MEMSYSADVDHIDEPVIEAAAEQKPGETIRIRVQPSIFRRVLGQHRMWPGVAWTVDCATPAEAVQLREALRAFFEAVVRVGPGPLIGELQSLDPPP
jgi:hypothetical protein